MYQNFVTFTDIMQNKADKIKIEFGFQQIQMPVYYVADKQMIEVLKKCVQEKNSNPSNLAKVSQ